MTKLLAAILSLNLLLSGCEQPRTAVLHPLNGAPISFSSLRGQWVVINYWASWCEPCRREVPEFNEFYHAHQNDNVKIFAVNYDQLPDKQLKELIKNMNIQYTSLETDPASELGLGDIPGLPATFIFSPDGRLVKKLFGEQTEKSLRAALSSSLS
jgi:thiol-disulfide isomerase/thioredoxin